MCYLCVKKSERKYESKQKFEFFFVYFLFETEKKMFYSAAYQMLFFDFCLFSNDQKKKVEKVLFFMYA